MIGPPESGEWRVERSEVERIQRAANQLRRVAIVHLAADAAPAVRLGSIIAYSMRVSAGRPCICHRLITRHPVPQRRRETIRDDCTCYQDPVGTN